MLKSANILSLSRNDSRALYAKWTRDFIVSKHPSHLLLKSMMLLLPLKNTKKAIKWLSDKVKQLKERTSSIEGDVSRNNTWGVIALISLAYQLFPRTTPISLLLNFVLTWALIWKPTKKVKERLIVKFVRRDKRDKIYKQRSKLIGARPWGYTGLPVVRGPFQTIFFKLGGH